MAANFSSQKIFRVLIIIIIIIRVFCPGADLSLQTQERRLQFCRRQVFHCKLRTKAAVLSGMNTCGSFPLLYAPHSLFLSLASEQTLEHLRRSQGHQRGGEESGFVTGPFGLHLNSPQALNISSIKVFD